jgi:GNAT superfamily N-acetyltransferase
MPTTPAVEVTIRRPRDAEGPACRMLLPEGRLGPRGKREFLVAVLGTGPQIAGAASFQPRARAIVGVRIRVVKSHRRQGVGSLLLRNILDEAALRQAEATFANADGRTEPDAAPFLAAHQFRFLGRITTVEAEMLAMRDYLVGMRDRLTAAGKIPSDVRLVRFDEAPEDQIAKLHAEFIQHSPEADPAVLRNPKFRMQTGASPVLMMGDRVAGFLLVGLDKEVCTVHARVVTPESRGRWVNALLMGAAMEDQWNAGGRRVRFDIPPGNRDTEKLARRFGAQTISAWDAYTRPIEGEPAVFS